MPFPTWPRGLAISRSSALSQEENGMARDPATGAGSRAEACLLQPATSYLLTPSDEHNRQLRSKMMQANPFNASLLLVHSKGDQPWDFFGGNDADAETPVVWPPHAKSWLIGKDSDAGRDREQEEKGTTEDEMTGGHHWLNGRESEWTPGVGDGQGGLACCDSWGHKE